MNYFYRFNEVPEPENTYYTAEEIRRVPIYPESLELRLEWLSNNDLSDLWPIHDFDGPEWEPINCKDDEEARYYLRVALNVSIYERVHDL